MPRRGLSKKWTIGIVAGAIVIIGAIGFFVFAGSTNREVARLLEENAETIETLENVLERAQTRDLITSDIMDAAMHEKLNQAVPQFSEFEEKFAKIDTEKVKASAREDVQQLQTTFARQAVGLRHALELYNISYDAYSTDNASALKPYLANENPTVAAIAEQLTEYVAQKRRLTSALSAKSCSLKTSGQSGECAELVAEYREVVDEMRQSFSVPQAILFAYDSEASYAETAETVARVKQVIEGLK